MPLLAFTSRFLKANPTFIKDITGVPIQFPGLPESGEAQRRRRQYTDFGSGWQGFLKQEGVNEKKTKRKKAGKSLIRIAAELNALQVALFPLESAMSAAMFLQNRPFFKLLFDWRKVGSEEGKIAWTQLASQHYGLDRKANLYPSAFGGLETSNLIETGKYKPYVSFLRKFSQWNYRLLGGNYAYRGVLGKQAEDILQSVEKIGKATVDLNALSAWSTNPVVAGRFAASSNPDPALSWLATDAGVVIKRRVSAKDVWFFSPTIGGSPSEVVVGTATGKIEVTAKDIFKLPRGSAEAPFGVFGPTFYKDAMRWKLHLWGDWNPRSLGFAHILPTAIVAGAAYFLYKHGRNKSLNEIEALSHGGESASSRRKHSDFGSGWRGLLEALATRGRIALNLGLTGPTGLTYTVKELDALRLAQSLAIRRSGLSAARIQRVSKDILRLAPSQFSNISEIEAIRPNRLGYERIRALNRWSRATGMPGILLNEIQMKAMTPGTVAEILRHEEIHAAQFAAYGHPFFAKLRKETGGILNELIYAVQQPKAQAYARKQAGFMSRGRAEMPWIPKLDPERMAEDILVRYVDLTSSFYTRQGINLIESKQFGTLNRMLESEPIAYHFQSNPQIMKEMEKAGIETTRTATQKLRHSLQEKGIAPQLRRRLTDFGSGWQGILRAVKGFRQEGVVFKVHPENFLRKVGGNVGVKRSVIEELKDKLLRGIQLDPGEIHFDEFGNVIGAEGRHRATAYMELGRQMPVRRMVRASDIMRTGEGYDATTMLSRRVHVRGSREMSHAL
jgi:hypothetical protein